MSSGCTAMMPLLICVAVLDIKYMNGFDAYLKIIYIYIFFTQVASHLLAGHNLASGHDEAEEASAELAQELMGEYLAGDTWT